ncbi:hypothetical protein [Caulobacter sp. HMWF025]|uniref:hypothetical protein n=2 Tax=unclassified Caulobacter TaxID=2648921 RepID=UPI000D368EA0|nr:hypothetical protein [Caulobacter sp. HMWF025]PTT06055.1 hypothetical protein DBR10_13960 [Caulobacter sp. HMWF025]
MFQGRTVGLMLAVALASTLSGCETPPAPPPPPPVVVAPPPPPPITLSNVLVERASAFRGYMARAGSIQPTFENGEQIQSSLKLAVAYEPRQLLQGATAYAAVIALQDPTFVGDVRSFAVDPAQRQQLINALIADPNYAVGFKGSDTAAGLIIDTLGSEGLRVFTTGKAVKQAAYDVQRSSWSKAVVADRDGRLAFAKTQSMIPALGETADIALLQQASIGAQPLGLTPRAAPGPYQPLVVRGLAVAALAALGAAGDANLATVEAVMAEPASTSCLSMAKLNLYQCLAVAKPHYEDVFCLGQHVLMDTGQCVIKAAGAPMPVEPPPPPHAVAEKRSITTGGAGRNSKKAKAAAARKAPVRK